MKTPTIGDYKTRLEWAFDIFGGGIKIKDISYGDLIPIKEWINTVNCGGFTDYDGSGQLATKRNDGQWLVSNQHVYPSDVTFLKLKFPEWATHVLWFNK